MKIYLDDHLQPIVLPLKVGPENTKYLVELCIFHAMMDSWQIFGETNREIAKESSMQSRLASKKMHEIRMARILVEHIHRGQKQA